MEVVKKVDVMKCDMRMGRGIVADSGICMTVSGKSEHMCNDGSNIEVEVDDNEEDGWPFQQGQRRRKKQYRRRQTLREEMGHDVWLHFREYVRTMSRFLCTTRFTDTTWNENAYYRETCGIRCIYGSPYPLKSRIPHDAIVFVLEMNNDRNRLMGIGLIRNHPVGGGRHRIYHCGNYNRYVYVGTHRIAREDMDEYEENVMKALDMLCFRGYKHMKRGNGINCFPDEILYKCRTVIDLVEFAASAFKRRLLMEKKCI